MGNLTRDPNISYTPGQTAVSEFGLAVNRKWKKQDGSQGEEVLFIECQVYGKRAEVINKHFEKGSPIFVQGRLKLEQWSGDDGKSHNRIRVIVENFEFIGSKQGGQNES
jgi:single-strand DNA-binding protein